MSIASFKQARRYAQAFLNQCAPEPSPELLKNLELFLTFLKTHPLIFTRLSSLITDESVQEKSFCMMTESFNLETPGKKLILILSAHKNIKLLPLVLRAIINEGQLRRGEFVCDIATSHDLSQTAKASLCRALNAQLGGTIIPTYHHDTSLIKGIRVTGKTFLWENSIAKKLKHCMAFITRQD